ncbi:endonuclease/exonuclease/phosphatase family protein [Nonomuraea sp. NPDC049486]|uniref:endonuclease/exonuclease/phosphatase family protein n=1 Tax=Nonomuraea sp. NPDC049486 TaxID=3155773 RepID=UPI0034437408
MNSYRQLWRYSGVKIVASLVAWGVTGAAAVWAALRLSGFEPDWPWVPAVAVTPHVAAAAGAGLVLAAALRKRAAAALALAATVALGFAVVPRSLADGGTEPAGAPLRVLAANLMVGVADTGELMALVARLRPDVLALQELTPDAMERLEEAGLPETFPYAVTRPRQGAGGSALYARHPLTPGEAIEHGRFGQVRAVLAHPGGARVELVSVHPCAPKRYGRQPCWRAGLEALPRAGGPLRVLAGDFNATLDHLPMRELLASGYRDAADVTGHGLRTTWPQGGWGPLPGVAIDHVLADSRIGVRSFGVHTLKGTDHHPVSAVLTLP